MLQALFTADEVLPTMPAAMRQLSMRQKVHAIGVKNLQIELLDGLTDVISRIDSFCSTLEMDATEPLKQLARVFSDYTDQCVTSHPSCGYMVTWLHASTFLTFFSFAGG